MIRTEIMSGRPSLTAAWLRKLFSGRLVISCPVARDSSTHNSRPSPLRKSSATDFFARLRFSHARLRPSRVCM